MLEGGQRCIGLGVCVCGWGVSGRELRTRSLDARTTTGRGSPGPEGRAQGGGHKARFVGEGGKRVCQAGGGAGQRRKGGCLILKGALFTCALLTPAGGGASPRRRLLFGRRGLRADPALCPFVGLIGHWASRPSQAWPDWRRPSVPE